MPDRRSDLTSGDLCTYKSIGSLPKRQTVHLARPTRCTAVLEETQIYGRPCSILHRLMAARPANASPGGQCHSPVLGRLQCCGFAEQAARRPPGSKALDAVRYSSVQLVTSGNSRLRRRESWTLRPPVVAHSSVGLACHSLEL